MNNKTKLISCALDTLQIARYESMWIIGASGKIDIIRYLCVRMSVRDAQNNENASSNGRFRQKQIARNDKSSQFHGPFAMQLENDESSVFFRHTRQLSNGWKRRRSDRCRGIARAAHDCLRGENLDGDFAKHGHRYFTRRGNRATRHQKRFSLIDLEGPRELDWNAPERYSIKFIPRDGKTLRSLYPRSLLLSSLLVLGISSARG